MSIGFPLFDFTGIPTGYGLSRTGGRGKGYGGRRLIRYYAEAETARRNAMKQHRESEASLMAYLVKKAEEIEWHRKYRERKRKAAIMAAFLSEL